MQAIITPDILLKAGELAIGAFLAWVAVCIKNNAQAAKIEIRDTKIDLMKNHAEMVADINDKHLENKETMVKHIASDEAQFKLLGETVKEIKETLVRLEDRTR